MLSELTRNMNKYTYSDVVDAISRRPYFCRQHETRHSHTLRIDMRTSAKMQQT